MWFNKRTHLNDRQLRTVGVCQKCPCIN